MTSIPQVKALEILETGFRSFKIQDLGLDGSP